jgi:hypothetical protein
MAQPDTKVFPVAMANPADAFWCAIANDVVGRGRTPLDAIVDLLNAERDAEQLAADVCRTAGL